VDDFNRKVGDASSRVNKSIAEAESSHKVVSYFHISGVPSHVVRRGVLTAKRKGSFKVAEVRFEELTTG